MPSKKRFSAACFALAVALGMLLRHGATAQTDAGQPPMWDPATDTGHFHAGDDEQQVKLTEIERVAMENLGDIQWKRQVPLRTEIIGKMCSSDDVDAAQLISLEKQVVELEAQRDAVRLDRMIQVRSLESPTQLAEAAQNYRKHVAAYEQERARQHHPRPETSYVATDDHDPKYPYEDGLGYTRGVSLSADQSRQIADLETSDTGTSTPLKQKYVKLLKEFADSFETDGPVDSEKLKAVWRQASDVKGEIMLHHFEMVLKVRALLTPAQLVEAAKLHQEDVAAARELGKTSLRAKMKAN